MKIFKFGPLSTLALLCVIFGIIFDKQYLVVFALFLSIFYFALCGLLWILHKKEAKKGN